MKTKIIVSVALLLFLSNDTLLLPPATASEPAGQIKHRHKSATEADSTFVFKAARPTLDLGTASGDTSFKIEGRIEQIQSAIAKDKLPLKLTVRARRDLRLAAPIPLKIATAKLETSAPKKLVATQTKIESTANTTAIKIAGDTVRHLSLVAASDTPDHEISPPAYRAAIKKLNFQNPHDLWAGHLKMTEEKLFQEDPSLNLHVAVGEKGATVFRFVRGHDGLQTLHPTMLFFAGRDENYNDSLMQRQRSDDPDSSSQGLDFFQAVAQTVGKIFGFKAGQSGPLKHFRYTYVNLGTVNAADKIGHYFVENPIRKSTTIVGANSLEQDIVLELSTNDSDAVLSYREIAVRLTKLSADTAFVKVARVNYAADRSIVSRQMFEGKVSTRYWQKITDEICALSGKSWDQTAAENDL